MIFRKKEEEHAIAPVVEMDIIDKLEMYARQLESDHNFGLISEQEYEEKRRCIVQGIDKIKRVLLDPDFNAKIHKVIDSIFEGGKE